MRELIRPSDEECDSEPIPNFDLDLVTMTTVLLEYGKEHSDLLVEYCESGIAPVPAGGFLLPSLTRMENTFDPLIATALGHVRSPPLLVMSQIAQENLT